MTRARPELPRPPPPPSRAPQLSASRLASRVAVTLLTSPEHWSLRWPSAAAAFGLRDLEGDVPNPRSLLSRGSRGCAVIPEQCQERPKATGSGLRAAKVGPVAWGARQARRESLWLRETFAQRPTSRLVPSGRQVAGLTACLRPVVYIFLFASLKLRRHRIHRQRG